MIKAVIFDLDNTLYAYDPAHAAGFSAVTEYAEKEFGIAPERFRELHSLADRVLRAHAGEGSAAIHSRLIRYQLLLEGEGLPITHAPRMAARYWEAFLAQVKPEPGTRETLELLRDSGLRLGLGSNMTAGRQYEKLERLGLLSLMDFMVCSEEAGAEKPERRLFDLCAQKAGCRAEECLFVGDDVERDIRGAQAAGMKTVWLRRGENGGELSHPTAQIRRIDELPVLLEKIWEVEKQ